MYMYCSPYNLCFAKLFDVVAVVMPLRCFLVLVVPWSIIATSCINLACIASGDVVPVVKII